MTATALRSARRLACALAAVALGLLLVLPAGPGAADVPLRLAAAPSDPLVVGTVPAVTGFPITVDGVTVLTDAAGQAHFSTPTVTDVPIGDRLVLTEATLPINGHEVIVRADKVYPSTRLPLLTLDLYYHVGFRFLGRGDTPIDPSDIGQVTVKSETGEIVDIEPGERTWLHGSRVKKRTDFWEIKPLMWRLVRVQYSGVNVVNASQQRFFPAEQQDVDVRLLFFRLDVRVHDAFYGFDAGEEIELISPNGTSRRFPLDDDARLTVAALPRGDYQLIVHGWGPPVRRPLALSRDQSVDLGLHTWLDIITVAGVTVGLAGGLAWAGRVRRLRDGADDLPSRVRRRGHLRRRHGAEKPTAAPASDAAVMHASRSDQELTR
jgi:hypothetical protein